MRLRLVSIFQILSAPSSKSHPSGASILVVRTSFLQPPYYNAPNVRILDNEPNDIFGNIGWHINHNCPAPTGGQDMEVKVNQRYFGGAVFYSLFGASPVNILRFLYKLNANSYRQH